MKNDLGDRVRVLGDAAEDLQSAGMNLTVRLGNNAIAGCSHSVIRILNTNFDSPFRLMLMITHSFIEEKFDVL